MEQFPPGPARNKPAPCRRWPGNFWRCQPTLTSPKWNNGYHKKCLCLNPTPSRSMGGCKTTHQASWSGTAAQGFKLNSHFRHRTPSTAETFLLKSNLETDAQRVKAAWRRTWTKPCTARRERDDNCHLFHHFKTSLILHQLEETLESDASGEERAPERRIHSRERFPPSTWSSQSATQVDGIPAGRPLQCHTAATRNNRIQRITRSTQVLTSSSHMNTTAGSSPADQGNLLILNISMATLQCVFGF